MRDVIKAMEFAKCQKEGENAGRPRWCSCRQRGLTTAGCLDSDEISEWKAALRAALVAMREPSASMAEAGDRVLVDTYCYSYRDDMPAVFRAMLDAALAELDGEAGE
jgi:hypothetical protein